MPDVPRVTETRVIGGPVGLEAICRAVGSDPDKYMGFIVTLIRRPADGRVDLAFHTDLANTADMAEVLYFAVETIRSQS